MELYHRSTEPLKRTSNFWTVPKTDIRTRTERAVSGSGTQYVEPAVPYYFSALASEREQDIRVGDYVKVSGLGGKYELMGIFPRYGSVRVREVGVVGELLIRWSSVKPWKPELIRSKTVIQAVGEWLFGGSRVYRLSEPTLMLKQKKIHWDAQTCDVEDEDGRVICDVPWDELEFADDVEFNFPDDRN